MMSEEEQKEFEKQIKSNDNKQRRIDLKTQRDFDNEQQKQQTKE
jgi:hypothetical protein